jgi:chromosome segregation ATPase
MSTAGKVLAVLSALMLVVWIVMISAVAQLNANSGQQLDKLKADVARLKTDVAQAKQSADDTLVKINEEQVGKERDMRLVRIRLSTAERQVSTTRESLSRLQIEVDNYTKSAVTAKEGLAQRNNEKAKYEKDKADEEAVVKRLQGQNAELTDQLLKLRTDFQDVLKENQAEVQKQLKGGKPTTRAASFIR